MPIQSMYQHSELPAWFSGQQQRLGEAAEGLRQAPYVSYPFNRLADFMNPDMEAAYNLARETGDVAPYLQEARNLLQSGAGEFTGEAAQRYMNPYTQSVIDNLIANSGRAFREEYLPALRREFISSGNYGGTQHNQQAERLAAQHQRTLNEAINKSLMEGYGHAGKMFESGQARKLEAAPQIGNLGPLQQASRIADIAALKEQGQERRAHEQTAADLRYQDFQKQQAFPYESLSHQASILSGMPQTPNVYRAEQTPGVPQLNTLGQLGALAGNIYGARMAYGRKAGGSIKQKPKGLSSLKLGEGTMARKPKPGGSHGIRPLKNKHKVMNSNRSYGS